jgi:hypothetical protein
VQQEKPGRNTTVAADDRIELRIGINLGDVLVEGDDFYGDGVNIATRSKPWQTPAGCSSPGMFATGYPLSLINIAHPVLIHRPHPTAKSPSAPLTVLPRARRRCRSEAAASLLGLTAVAQRKPEGYWNGTAPVHFFYRLQEALRKMEEEGLDNIFARNH